MARLSILLAALYALPATARALELSGYAAGEFRGFAHAPLYPEQKLHSGSFVLEPELHQPLGSDNLSVTASPFWRADSSDPERTHFDMRELFLMLHGDEWEVRAGLDKVFWGVTEAAHVVDIVNQTDVLEGFDEEDKLGQPMVKLSLSRDIGTLDLYLLPYFRERPFPGAKGRLRAPLVARGDAALYESAAEEWHTDAAARLSGSLSVFDLGLSYFRGTGREPILAAAADPSGKAIYVPVYPQIEQFGLDAQMTVGAWLWKLEAVRRGGHGRRTFYASAFGFEYTVSGLLGTSADLGVLSEWLFDDRGRFATQAADGDVMLGARLAFGDAQGTELLAFVVHDYRDASRVLTVESSRRLTDHWKLEAQGYAFLGASPSDLTYLVRDDDFFELRLGYYW